MISPRVMAEIVGDTVDDLYPDERLPYFRALRKRLKEYCLGCGELADNCVCEKHGCGCELCIVPK